LKKRAVPIRRQGGSRGEEQNPARPELLASVGWTRQHEDAFDDIGGMPKRGGLRERSHSTGIHAL